MEETATRFTRAALAALHHSGIAGALAPWTRGLGAVLMLHHVRPEPVGPFAPNRILQVTPRFLETVVIETRRAGYDIVSLDEALSRLQGHTPSRRPFTCFTFDDGYRDNAEHAYPVLKRHGVPFTVYVTTAFADGKGFLWWLVLERVIAARRSLDVVLDGVALHLDCSTAAAKAAAFKRVYWPLRRLPEQTARAVVRTLAEETGLDILAPCRELAMTWDEIRALAADPLVTIGAHTVQHLALAKLPYDEARAEIAGSVRRVAAELGRPCRHFCYPYGDETSAGDREFRLAAELGLATAVTTRKSLVQPGQAAAPTAIPRLSLNGDYQRVDCFRSLLSGLPFALRTALRGPGRTPPARPLSAAARPA